METIMTHSPETAGSSRIAWLISGVALAATAIAANFPYASLIDLFDYDDVLRRPPGEVLAAFHAAGAPLVWAWWTFGLSAFGLAIAALALGEALKGGAARLSPLVSVFGVLSGVLQAAALFRWTFAVPQVATSWANAAPGSADRAAAEAVYLALNGFGGMAIGEHLGQLLLVVWTVGVALALWRTGGVLRWIGVAGLATVPLWIIGQTEILGAAIPGLTVVEVIPYAFIGWELWLLAVGIAMLVRGVRGTP
jgi:hypothetical protein